MEKLRNDLMALIQLGYEYDAQMNLGDGWEPYEGCRQNLLMILEDPDTQVRAIDENDELYVDGRRRYTINLPQWGRKGSISLIFDESELRW